MIGVNRERECEQLKIEHEPKVYCVWNQRQTKIQMDQRKMTMKRATINFTFEQQCRLKRVTTFSARWHHLSSYVAAIRRKTLCLFHDMLVLQSTHYTACCVYVVITNECLVDVLTQINAQIKCSLFDMFLVRRCIVGHLFIKNTESKRPSARKSISFDHRESRSKSLYNFVNEFVSEISETKAIPCQFIIIY